MDKRWTCVFNGGYGEALLLQSELEAREIPAFVPDQNLKLWYPYVTGGNIFAWSVFVPADARDRALDILGGAPSLDSAEAPAEMETPPPDPEDARQEARARWICWSAPFEIAAPWAWCLFVAYLFELRRPGHKSRRHGQVFAAMSVNTANLVSFWPFVRAALRGEVP